MASPSSTIKTITGHCYCKAVNFALSLPTSNLPHNAHMCHCSICRYILGALCCFHAPLPRGITPEFIGPSSIANLARYAWPGGLDDWVFCSTCGSHVGTVNPRSDNTGSNDEDCWTISTSLFSKDETVFKLASHAFTHSAIGGGLDEWLPAIGDRQLAAWNPSNSTPAAIPPRSEASSDSYGDRLLAQCHCKGVSMRLRRPRPDLRPFASPVDSTKWIGVLCLCDSCRLATSAHVTAWSYVPLRLVEVGSKAEGNSGEDLEWSGVKDAGLPLESTSAKAFESSPGVRRSFCGTCGATVMYRQVARGDLVAIPMGIMRAPEGVRAEDWVTWIGGKVVGMEDGLKYDRDFAEAVAEGLRKWSVERYGEAYKFPTE